jgi:hypothetical protein
MSTSKKDSNENVDIKKIYKTKASACLCGRALAIDLNLNDASLPTKKSKPHMTVFFRRSGFSQTDIDR